MNLLTPVVLPALARDLLTQISTFGLIGQNSFPELKELEWLAADRIAPARLLMQLLAEAGDRSVLPPDAPLLYHRTGWPATAPPAGRVSHTDAVTGANYLDSLMTFWVLQLQNKADPIPAAVKLVRAMLWTVRERGFLAAVEDLAALGTNGFICQSTALIEAFDLLMRSRRLVPDDSMLVDRLLPEAKNCAVSDWGTLALAPIDLDAPSLRPELDDDLDLLVEITDDLIARTRAASDYSEWVLGYWRLGMMARTTHITLRRLGVADDLAYAGFAARYEEISADTFSFTIGMRGSEEKTGERLAPNWALASAMAKIAKANDSDRLERILDRTLRG